MKKRLLGIVLGVCIVLTGCSIGKKDANSLSDGYEAVASQNYQEALNCFDKSHLQGDDSELTYRGMGLAYMGIGDYAKAISSFQNALASADMFPGDLEYDINYYMAICYYKLGEYEDAISVYDSIINLVPKARDAYYLRGSMKLYLDDVEGAMNDFNEATSIDKDDYGMYLDVYQCMESLGYKEEAQPYIDVVLSVDQSEISPYDAGRACYYQGQYEKGCIFLENARKNQTNPSAELTTFLCDCYKKAGNYDFAAVVYSTYLENNKEPEIYNQLGLCYVEQGEYELALSAFQSGIAVEEGNTCIQVLKLNEIACYEYLYEYDAARDKMAEYLAEYPQNKTLKKEYAFLTTR